jgi:hypothetical protein
MVRKPAVAGYFYPGSAQEVKSLIERLQQSPLGPGRNLEEVPFFEQVNGVVSPHAGYIYSGAVACWSFAALSRINRETTFCIIGPNHRGYGASVALSKEEEWLTPLGKVVLDLEAASFLVEKFPVFAFDEQAHLAEHSIEVQIPFLQYFVSCPFKILPVALLDQRKRVAQQVAEALYALSAEKNLVIVASSDFSHYEPAEVAERKDRQVISYILSLDVDGFYAFLRQASVSVCGPGAIATLMFYQKLNNAPQPRFLKYAHSGEVSGDFSQVVGYASLVFPG